MAHQGKKFKNAAAKVDRGKKYSIEDACNLVPETKVAKFDESVDIAVRLGVDPKHADQMVRGAVVLPHGTGKSQRVIVVEADTTRWWRGPDESADVTARGSLDDLYLFVWNRFPADRLDVSGDRGLLTRWQAAASV